MRKNDKAKIISPQGLCFFLIIIFFWLNTPEQSISFETTPEHSLSTEL